MSNTSNCPKCGATIPYEPLQISWCDCCNWNVNPTAEPVKPRSIQGLYRRIGSKLNRQLFEQAKSPSANALRFSKSTIVAFGLAIIVHSLTIGVAMAGLYFVIQGSFFVLLLGLLLIGIAYFLRPSFGQMPTNLASEADFPVLMKLIRSVAEATGAPAVDAVLLTEDFNASIGRLGLRQKTLLKIGGPLLYSLNAQEKVSLIAHELAHVVSGDPLRGTILYTAVQSIYRWAYLIRPESLFFEGPNGLLASIVWLPLNIALAIFSELNIFVAHLLLRLVFRDSQLAEYRADRISAEVGGTAGAIGSLNMTMYSSVFASVAHRVSLNRNSLGLYDEFSRTLKALPEREKERVRRFNLLDDATLDTTHPPTGYRIGVLQATTFTSPKCTLASAEDAMINEELRKLETRKAM